MTIEFIQKPFKLYFATIPVTAYQYRAKGININFWVKLRNACNMSNMT